MQIHTTAHKSEPKPKFEIIWDTSLGIGGSSKTKTSTQTTSKPSTSSGSKTTTASTAHSSNSHTSTSSSSGSAKHTTSSNSTSHVSRITSSTNKLDEGIHASISIPGINPDAAIPMPMPHMYDPQKELEKMQKTIDDALEESVRKSVKARKEMLESDPKLKIEKTSSLEHKDKAEIDKLQEIEEAKSALPSAIDQANKAYEKFIQAREAVRHAQERINVRMEDARKQQLIDSPSEYWSVFDRTRSITAAAAGVGFAHAGYVGAIILGFNGALAGFTASLLENTILHKADNSAISQEDLEDLNQATSKLNKAHQEFAAKDDEVCELIKKANGKIQNQEIEYPLKWETIKKEFKL